MRFVVEQPVFSDPATDPLALMAFFDACRDTRRHLVLTDPVYRSRDQGAPVGVWLAGQAPRAREAVEHILRTSVTESAVAGRKLEARVVRGALSHWEKRAGIPRAVSVADAARLAQAPLKLLVENQRSDGEFLRRVVGVAAEHERATLERALAESWAQVENGGGLEDLRAWVTHLTESQDMSPVKWVARLRLWAMFDRDAHPADRSKPSESSDETCRALEALGRRCGEGPPMHRLARRAIENYLPRQTLSRWCEQHRAEEKVRLRAATNAFAGSAMDDPDGDDRRRASFNMKEGLIRDAPHWRRVRAEIKQTPRALRDEEIDAIYRDLSVEDRLALADGFGEDVGKRCFPDRALVQDEWLVDAVSPEERQAILRGILERL